MKNFSDGKSDGMVIMYTLNGIAYPVVVAKEDLETLDMLVGTCFEHGISIVKSKPTGRVEVIERGNKYE